MFIFLLGIASTTSTAGHTLNSLPAQDNQPVNSPYQGQYAGPFTAKGSVLGVATEQVGKISLSVNEEGDATGKVDNYTSGTTANLRGAIDEDGSIVLAVKYPTSTSTVKGTVKKTKDGHLKGY